MPESDIIVIGGGLSGTTFAHFTAMAGHKVTLLEKRDTPGGCINTVYSKENNNFFIELGAHTIYSSYATLLEMIENLGLKDSIVPQAKPGYLAWADGRVQSLFARINFGEALLAPFRFGKYKKHGLTVKDYYTGILGRQNYENLVHPMTSAVICQDSSLVAADLLLKTRPKNKSYPRSFTMTDGLLTFFKAVGETKGLTARTGVRVDKIEYSQDLYKVYISTGEVYTASRLAVAATAPESAHLIEGWLPEIAVMLRELPMQKTIAAGFCASKEVMKLRPFSYLIVQDEDFRSVVSRDVVPDPVYRGGTFHYKPDTDPNTYERNIRKVYEIDPSTPIQVETACYTLPRLGIEHYEWKKRLEERLENIENFYLLGNFFDGLSMEDCAIRAKKEAIRAGK